MSGFSLYYVTAENTVPGEEHPGLYFAVDGESHGPFSSRQAAYEAWLELRSAPHDDFILEPRGDEKP